MATSFLLWPTYRKRFMRSYRLTILILLIVTTLVALTLALTLRGLNGSPWGVAFASASYIVLITFALYVLLFAVMYPLGRLNQFLDRQSETLQSPFAQDRLPEQMVLPQPDNDKAH
jgi:uncharacterized membrane protein (UPF0182 family)